jgi:hypothetical protein
MRMTGSGRGWVRLIVRYLAGMADLPLPIRHNHTSDTASKIVASGNAKTPPEGGVF